MSEQGVTQQVSAEALRHLAAEWRKVADELEETGASLEEAEAVRLRLCADTLEKHLPAPPGPVRVSSRGDLVLLARVLGVRPDWHEPDEQGVSAKVHGVTLDNAGFWGTNCDEVYVGEGQELWVSLHRDGVPVAEVNLADLLAWASAPQDLRGRR
jgi:hypothetical protein